MMKSFAVLFGTLLLGCSIVAAQNAPIAPVDDAR